MGARAILLPLSLALRFNNTGVFPPGSLEQDVTYNRPEMGDGDMGNLEFSDRRGGWGLADKFVFDRKEGVATAGVMIDPRCAACSRTIPHRKPHASPEREFRCRYVIEAKGCGTTPAVHSGDQLPMLLGYEGDNWFNALKASQQLPDGDAQCDALSSDDLPRYAVITCVRCARPHSSRPRLAESAAASLGTFYSVRWCSRRATKAPRCVWRPAMRCAQTAASWRSSVAACPLATLAIRARSSRARPTGPCAPSLGRRTTPRRASGMRWPCAAPSTPWHCSRGTTGRIWSQLLSTSSRVRACPACPLRGLLIRIADDENWCLPAAIYATVFAALLVLINA